MPPVLDPNNSKVDGLAFLGLSLTQNTSLGHADSTTHQTAFDFNEVQDRGYHYLASSNDDGWLVGGGEPGPPASYKLAAPDSAHVEIMRIGTYRPEWGGITAQEVLDALASGRILVPEITVVPTAVVGNGDRPPELEIRFDMDPPTYDIDRDESLPVNWQLRFLHNQLFEYFQYPSRFCPGAFHSTILRRAEFRSKVHEHKYFERCQRAVQAWRAQGPQPLVPTSLADDITVIQSFQETAELDRPNLNQREGDDGGEVGNVDAGHVELVADEKKHDDAPFRSVAPDKTNRAGRIESVISTESAVEARESGIYLFTDRNTITHRILPNFLPPYDTPERKQIIYRWIRSEWDAQVLDWKPAGWNSQSVARASASRRGADIYDGEGDVGQEVDASVLDCGALAILLALD